MLQVENQPQAWEVDHVRRVKRSMPVRCCMGNACLCERRTSLYCRGHATGGMMQMAADSLTCKAGFHHQGWGKGSRGWNMATIQGVTLRSTAARSAVIQAIWVAEMSMLVEV